jgi:uncharacterized protein
MAATTFWIGIGDIHDDVAALDRLAGIPDLADAAGIIVSGDLTVLGDAAKARRVLEAVRRLHPVILAQIGNMDRADVDAYLTGEGVNIHATGRVTPQGVGIFGVGWSTPTPFGTPSEAGEERIAAWLEAAQAAVAGCEHLLFVCHTPPVNTAVDTVRSGQHVGSPAVRAFIERVQPDVCLTGHIHEARGEDVIGRTRIVNPGALSDGHFARIALDPAVGLTAAVAPF